MSFVATIFLLAAAVEPVETDIAAHLEAAANAWTKGDLVQAGSQARRALELIEASDCPVRPDAAYAAFMSAVGEHVNRQRYWSEYALWAAHRLDLIFGILPVSWAEASRRMKGQPGGALDTDYWFASSPYRQMPRSAPDCAARVLAEAPEEPETSQYVVAAFGIRRPGTRISRVEVIYGYPSNAAAALAARLEGVVTYRFGARETEWLVFNPCITLAQPRGRPTRLCYEPDSGEVVYEDQSDDAE